MSNQRCDRHADHTHMKNGDEQNIQTEIQYGAGNKYNKRSRRIAYRFEYHVEGVVHDDGNGTEKINLKISGSSFNLFGAYFKQL